MNSSQDPSHVYTINTGKKQGTTFKIDTDGYVFSCLFDSGAEISCINMETVATLGLLSKITDSSVTVNTASGQNMDVAGDIHVMFKMGKSYSFTHRLVVCKHLSRPFILGEDFLCKHHMTLGWAPGKKRTLGYLSEIIAIASQEVSNEPLVLRSSIRIPARNCAVVPIYCEQMFSGKVTTLPCDELMQKFPNIYLELMQMDNSEGKNCDTIPYMIVNLDYHAVVYISKDTLVVYIHDKDVPCEYLEVNEVVESTQGINWQSSRK